MIAKKSSKHLCETRINCMVRGREQRDHEAETEQIKILCLRGVKEKEINCLCDFHRSCVGLLLLLSLLLSQTPHSSLSSLNQLVVLPRCPPPSRGALYWCASTESAHHPLPRPKLTTTDSFHLFQGRTAHWMAGGSGSGSGSGSAGPAVVPGAWAWAEAVACLWGPLRIRSPIAPAHGSPHRPGGAPRRTSLYPQSQPPTAADSLGTHRASSCARSRSVFFSFSLGIEEKGKL